ncbi:MAG: VOC family protein [Chloroflexi bacterium]|jgi:catechol 2,3-dioxygenase-like lactoylglutathione lyase family enzyme|nr:VOC family protein [Chloroflexota bacterium]
MPSIARLGHVGLYCNDLDAQKRFYHEVLGLTVTDEDPQAGMVFLSARPAEEHHELLLCRGRTAPADAQLVQQVSFRCHGLQDVVEYHDRLRQAGAKIEMVVSHGNAIGLYFRDPENNIVEVYCGTGLEARQPYLEEVDLSQPPERIMEQIRASVAEHGTTGYVDPEFLRRQNIAVD